MNCLGVPFERLFAIDEAARRAIRASHHKPSELYLDEEYFRSLQLPFSFRSSKEVSKSDYMSKMSKVAQHYVMTNAQALALNLRNHQEDLAQRIEKPH